MKLLYCTIFWNVSKDSRHQCILLLPLSRQLSMANFWGSFFSAFMSTWMGEFQHLFHSAFGVSCMLLHGYLRPVPKATGAYQAAGNTASCTAQGFFDCFFYGLSVVMNSVLAFTYCIIVKKGKKDEATRASRRLVSASLWNDVKIVFILILISTCST
jgi:hypothetical protein